MKRQARPPLIVFVCEHGSAKSLVAASFCARLAKGRGLKVRAVSRGMSPDPGVPAEVARALRNDGFDVASFRPRALGDSDLLGAALVVAIGVDIGEQGLPAGTPLERWDDIPPVSVSYVEARTVILTRIDSLLGRMDRSGRDRSPDPGDRS